MNRRDRRRLEREGKIPKSEPTYNIKPSELTKAAMQGVGKEAAEAEIKRQILEMDKQYTLDMDVMVLWALHTFAGFGAKRLKAFYLHMFQEHLNMRNFYEMGDTYPERVKLKEIGCDVESWYNALFDTEGQYKDPKEVSL